MDLQKYRVKDGAALAHAGDVLRGGAVVELPPHVGYEVRHLVDPIDPVTGQTQPWGSADQAALETELAKARPHERVTILEEAVAKQKAGLEFLQGALAGAKKQEADAAKALEQKNQKAAPSKTDASK